MFPETTQKKEKRKETPFYTRLMDVFQKSVRKSDLPLTDAAGKRLQQRHSSAMLAWWCGVDGKRMRALKQRDTFKKDELVAIARKTGLDLNWLMTGTGEPWAPPTERPAPPVPPVQDVPDVPAARAAALPTAPAAPLVPPPRPAHAALLAEMGAGAPPPAARPAPVAPPPAPPEVVPSMPLLGLAACGSEGWQGRITFPVPVPAPHRRQGMAAVLAYGTSLLPAGIGDGHICFCDPHAEPQPGEVVYVEHVGGAHAILKEFLGYGVCGAAPGELALRGWLPPEGGAEPDAEGLPPRQKAFVLRLRAVDVRLIAPVVYVQRRY